MAARAPRVVTVCAVAFAFVFTTAGCDEAIPPPEEEGPDYEHIIQPGQEDKILGAVQPFQMDGEVSEGFRLTDVEINRGIITYRMVSADDADRWVKVQVHHGGDPQAPAEEVSAKAPCCLFVVVPAPSVERAQVAGVAGVLIARLSANSDLLKEAWIPRALSTEESRNPVTTGAGAGANGTGSSGSGPAATQGGGGASAGQGSFAWYLRQLLTTDRILIGAGVLLLLLILFGGKPAFLRRKTSARAASDDR